MNVAVIPLKQTVATYNDLTACDYFGAELAPVLTAVGWLEAGDIYKRGRSSFEVYERLTMLSQDPWQPSVFAGGHHCSLCQFSGPMGFANLFIPNGSKIYVCPELITHYIACHHYLPPTSFIEAVMRCPDTRAMDYKRLLLDSGGRPLVQNAG